MGRPRVNAVLPRYASQFTDRHGKVRVRLRRTGWPTTYVQAEPGTPEFTEEYRRWEKAGKIKPGDNKVIPGTFDDLISRFYRSKTWAEIKPSTRETYRGELERFRAKYGSRRVRTMQAKHINNLIGAMGETPSAANNLLKRLGQLFDFAILLGWQRDNPARAVKRLKTSKGGFTTWQEAQIEQFEACHPIGTMPRLAFDLALYTAQRKSDVRTLGPQHVSKGWIKVKQLKTDVELDLPIDPRLARSIAATKTGHLAFIISARGAPFTYDGFGMWFMRQCRKAGLVGYSMHGLRKAAARRMAERGLSNQLIKSITGHSSDAEVARYTRGAEQARMAGLAGLAMLSDEDLANQPANDANTGCR